MTLPNKFSQPHIIPLVTALGLREKWSAQAWEGMIRYLSALDRVGLSDALALLLSAREREHIIKRAAIIDWLGVGMSYNQIQGELHVSEQTIRSIRRALKAKQYHSYAERSKTERKKKTRVSISAPREHRDGLKRSRRTKYGTISSSF